MELKPVTLIPVTLFKAIPVDLAYVWDTVPALQNFTRQYGDLRNSLMHLSNITISDKLSALPHIKFIANCTPRMFKLYTTELNLDTHNTMSIYDFFVLSGSSRHALLNTTSAETCECLVNYLSLQATENGVIPMVQHLTDHFPSKRLRSKVVQTAARNLALATLSTKSAEHAVYHTWLAECGVKL